MNDDFEDDVWQQVNEVERARLEDPCFAVDLAKARARANGEAYKPEKHGPHETRMVPKMARLSETKPMIDMESLLARFNAKGPAPGPNLRAVPNGRDFKRAASGER